MKTQLLMAVAGGAALVMHLLLKKYSTVDKSPTFEPSRHANRHLRNVFARLKKRAGAFADSDINEF